MPDTTESFTARFFWAATLLILFGLAEALLGSLAVHNPAVVADAGHNVSDGLVMLIFTLFEAVATVWDPHLISCTGRRITGIIAYLGTIGLIGKVVYDEAGQNQHHLSPWLVIPIGLASFGLNYWLAGYTDTTRPEQAEAKGGEQTGENPIAKGLSNHLKMDAFLSVALILGALLAYFIGDSHYNAGTAIVMLLVVTWHNLREIWEMAISIHRAENHHAAVSREDHHGHHHGPTHSREDHHHDHPHEPDH